MLLPAGHRKRIISSYLIALVQLEHDALGISDLIADWVVLPVASFDAHFETTSFGRKYLRIIPGEILERPDSGFGVCRYRVREKYRI